MYQRTIENFDDAFDEEGLLKDGRTARTRMMARDSRDRPRAVDGFGRPPGNRPGFILDASPAAHDAKARAYRAYENWATNRWRDQDDDPVTGGPRGQQEGDLCTTNGYAGVLRRDEDGKLVCVPNKKSFNGGEPASDGANVKEAAYRAYDAELANAWRRG
jgi:hypothetical protein